MLWKAAGCARASGAHQVTVSKKVGIVGWGYRPLLSPPLEGFACEIYAYDPYADKEAAGALGVSLVSLDELLDASDYVSLHVPNTQETRNMFSRGDLCQDEEDRLPH